MENTLTPTRKALAPGKRVLHSILPAQAYEMAAEEAPRVGRKVARANVGTATTCRGTVFTVIYSLSVPPPDYEGRNIELAACGTGDYFSEALELALEDFAHKLPEWKAAGYFEL